MSTLLLCGDVMTGRGIDQVLPHPGDPRLRESHVTDARYYAGAAMRRNGRIRLPVPFSWPWGSTLAAIDAVAPDARVINLETGITRSGEFAAGKAVHYRMSPDNLPTVGAGRPDVCVLANNHVLDFGRRGLLDTLRLLGSAGLAVAGAGSDLAAASRPAVVPLGRGGRLVVFAAATESSGVPAHWAATETGPGVHRLPDLSDATAAAVVARVAQVRRPGDVVVFSVHWGSNWGYTVPDRQIRFAHRLVEGGVDIVHGHSSHHPRPIEMHRGRLILYGCGDLINDYEGITGLEAYRDDLRLLYFPAVDPATGELTGLRMLPVRAVRLRLQHASAADTDWLGDILTRTGDRFGTRISRGPDGMLVLTART